ncbi:uncharacterized protein L201_007782 [Kwoniella dendrophila CBS 6074]|uniref:Protein ARV n=1 Tax=Kwoniella dendrophila CBS 6074 TaxID=1295534 RepID=A0AAX4K6U9_9TREE
MPVCTNCAYPADHVYTTYKTKSNIRLGVCARCDHFLDPLIEHPDLIILLDLILLKPRVFLHLLFNRGSPPYDADQGKAISADDRTKVRKNRLTQDLWRLGALSIVAETILRLLPTKTKSLTTTWIQAFTVTAIVCLEGFTQHAVTLALALLALKKRGWIPSSCSTARNKELLRDGRQENFVPILIPLTILYTSLLPLLLQLVLSIWYTPPPSIHEHLPFAQSSTSILSNLPFQLPQEYLEIENALNQAWFRSDRVWVGTRLLGGMSAGFGLRVLLPTKPWETTAIVLAGWMGAAVVPHAMNYFKTFV